MARRGGAGTPLYFKRPLTVQGGVRNSRAMETLVTTTGGAASGQALDEFQATVITATAANMVYTLPNPTVGRVKHVFLNSYLGDADDLIIACAATDQTLNGQVTNTIVVTSSQTGIVMSFYGTSTSDWASVITGGAAYIAAMSDITYTNSTVSTTTDVT